jgi:hypothetical protein
MLITQGASLAVSIARGVLKLAGRLDKLSAENKASGANLVLPLPKFKFSTGINTMLADFQRLVNNSPDLIEAADLQTIQDSLHQANPDKPTLTPLYRKYFPHKYFVETIDPEKEYLETLQRVIPDIDLEDPDIRRAAFYIGAGKDDREISYSYRVGLLIADVVAEFGTENTGLFIRDESLQKIVQSIAQRFSKPDLETYTEWSAVTKHALSSTLNGLLDNKSTFKIKEPWLNAILDSMVAAREAGGDDFMVGLLQGKGYQLLIGEALEEAATLLGENQANPWENVLSGVLTEIAPKVKAHSKPFQVFFAENWGNIVRASLKGVVREGDKILDETDPLLKTTLLAMIESLSEQPRINLLSSEVLTDMIDAGIAAAAEKPDLLADGIREAWFKGLVTSVVTGMGQAGVQKSFTKKGLENIYRSTLSKFGENPHWIVEKPGLAQEITGKVLKEMSAKDLKRPEDLAEVILNGGLKAIEENPQLLGTEYPDILASFAGNLAEKVASRSLSNFQAADLVDTFIETLHENPQLFVKLENKLMEVLVNGVLDAEEDLDDTGKLLLKGSVLPVISTLFQSVAERGQFLTAKQGNTLKAKIASIVGSAITRAAAEVGSTISLPTLPNLISDMALKILKEDWNTIDSNDPQFEALFTDILEKYAA